VKVDEDNLHIGITTDAEKAIQDLDRLDQKLEGLGQKRVKTQVEIDHEQAKRDLAELENLTARMRAQAVGIEVDVVGDADRDLQALIDDTKFLNASVVNVKVGLDTSEARRQLALYEQETARLALEKLGVTVTLEDQASKPLHEIELKIRELNAMRARVNLTATADSAPDPFEGLRREVAEIDNQTARMRAQKVGLQIDNAQAERSLQEVQLDTQKVNALVAQKRALEIDTTQASEGLGQTLQRLQAIVAYSAGYQAFHAIEQGAQAAMGAIIGFNDTLERTQIAFTQMLGSSSAATDMLAQLKQFAISTPFQFDGLTQSAQQLMAMGVAARDVIPDLTAIGDAVAGVAGDQEVLNRVVLAFGQISAAGKATAQDLRQLTQAGIPAYEMLAKALGTDVAGAMKQVTAGAVDSQTAIDALISGIEERSGGLMKAQMGTLQGQLSNLKDTMQQELADLGKPIFESVKQLVAGLGEGLSSEKFKAVATDIIQVVEELLGAFTKLAEFLANVPTGLIEWGIRAAEVAVGLRAINTVVGGVQTALRATATFFALETAATKADTVATEENTIAHVANAASRQSITMGGAIGAPIQSAVTATRGGLAAGTATAAEAAGALAMPVTVAATVLFVSAAIGDQIQQHLNKEAAKAHEQLRDQQLNFEVSAALNVAGVDSVTAEYEKLGRQIQQTTDMQKAFAQSSSGLANAVAPGLTGDINALKAAQAQVDPNYLQRQADEGLQKMMDQAKRSVEDIHGKGSTEEIAKNAQAAKDAILGMGTAYVMAHGDIEEFTKAVIAFNQAIDDQTIASQKRLVQQQQQHDQMVKDAAEIAKEASATGLAQPVDVMAGLEGTDKASADQIKLIKDHYSQLEQEQKDAQQRILESARKFDQDLSQAVQQAQQAVGRVDLSKGLTGLANVAPDLQKAQEALSELGRSSGALDNLTAIASSFQAITDAEHDASEAFDGYLTLFDETDRRIKVLDDLKKKLDDQVKAAQDAQKIGTATPEQTELLGKAATAYANIDAIRGRLQNNQIQDLFGMGQNVEDLLTADNTMRSIASQYGSMKDMRITVETNVKQVESDLDALTNKPRTVYLDVKTRGGTGGPGIDYAGGGDYGGTGSGFDPYGYARQMLGAGVGGNTATPRGDATALKQYYDIIQQAASTYHVDPTLIGAIIMHESGGTAGAVQQGGLGRGLMQVDLGQHPGENETLLTGTTREAVTYQIMEGAKILAQSLAAAGGDIAKGIQGYAGSAYVSQANQEFGVPAGLSFSQELSGYYTGPVGNVFAGGGGGGGATTNVSPQLPQVNRVSLTQPTSNPLAGSNINVAAMRKRAQELAGQAYVYGGGHSAGDTGGFDCSGYVAEVMRAGGINVPWTDAGGLYKWAQTSEGQAALAAAGIQLGFYNPGAGGMNEHVAINVGGDWFESGGMRGDTSGPSPNAAQGLNTFVGTPRALGGGGGGVAGLQTTGGGGAAGPFGTTNIFAESADSIAAATRAAEAQGKLQSAIDGAKNAQQAFNDSLKNVDPRNVANITEQFSKLLPVMQKAEQTKLPDNATALEKQTAIMTAYQKTYEGARLWGEAITEIDTGTGDLAATEQKIAETIGGPVSDAMKAQLDIMKEQKATADQIAMLTQRKSDLETQYKQIQQGEQDADRQRQRDQQLQQRQQQDADTQRQRSRTLEQRQIEDSRTAANRQYQAETDAIQNADRLRQVAHQNAMRGIEDRTNAENDGWTQRSRQLQQQQEQLQHYGTLQKQQLQDAQKARDEAHTADERQRSAQGQLYSVSARVSTTETSALYWGAAASALKDLQTTADELYQNQTDDNKKLQDEQDRAAAEQLYQLQQQVEAEQNAHEDRLKAIEKESTTLQRNYEDETNRLTEEADIRQKTHQMQMDLWQDEDTARQRAYEDEQFNIEQTRQQQQRANEDQQYALEQSRIAEQRQYEQALQSIDDEITAQKALAQEEQNRLDGAQRALSLWQQADNAVGDAAQTLLDALGSIGGLGTPTHKATGGTVGGTAIVGDSPGGDLSTAEVVTGNFNVIPHDQAAALGYIPGGGMGRYLTGGQGNGGDSYTLNFNASGNRDSDQEMFAKLTEWVEQRQRASDITIRRNSLSARSAAQGGPRY